MPAPLLVSYCDEFATANKKSLICLKAKEQKKGVNARSTPLKIVV
jgi:hypothetical protein